MDVVQYIIFSLVPLLRINMDYAYALQLLITAIYNFAYKLYDYNPTFLLYCIQKNTDRHLDECFHTLFVLREIHVFLVATLVTLSAAQNGRLYYTTVLEILIRLVLGLRPLIE